MKRCYPTVAPAYGEARRAMVKKIGVDRKPKANSTEDAAAKARKVNAPAAAE